MEACCGDVELVKVLIIKLSSLGDIIHALPTLNEIKFANPDWQIDWLVNKSFSSVLLDQDSINKIHTLEDKKLSTYASKINELKKENYDITIDLQGLIKTAAMSAQLAKRRVGFKSPREKIASMFYTEKVDAGDVFDVSKHVIEKNLEIAKYLGAELKQDASSKNILNYGGIFTKNLNSPNGSNEVCIIPSTTWQTKLWAADSWAKLISRLIEEGAKVYILGTSSDKENIDKIFGYMNASIRTNPNLLNCLDKYSLTELPKFFSSMNLVIGVDTGPLHIAAASLHGKENYKVLGLYGPSSARRSGPYGFKSISVDELKGIKASNKRKDDDSMSEISLEQVYGLLN